MRSNLTQVSTAAVHGLEEEVRVFGRVFLLLFFGLLLADDTDDLAELLQLFVVENFLQLATELSEDLPVFCDDLFGFVVAGWRIAVEFIGELRGSIGIGKQNILQLERASRAQIHLTSHLVDDARNSFETSVDKLCGFIA